MTGATCTALPAIACLLFIQSALSSDPVGSGMSLMARRTLVRGFLLLVLLLAPLAAGEGFVRWQGARDADGTFQFRGRPIRPFALPVKSARSLVDRYLSSSSSFLIYDPELGWRHRPNARTADQLHRTNAAGLRADREYSPGLRPGLFRVSMFGDSFILGSDVDQPDAPGAQLETLLNQRGVDAEVLNFGVNAYGIDQAYLRWQRSGRRYQPAVVPPMDVLLCLLEPRWLSSDFVMPQHIRWMRG